MKGHYGGIEHTEDEVPEEDIIATTSFARTPRAVQRGGRRNVVAELFQVLEKSKDDIGLQYYSVGATTLNDVFLKVVRENNVLEEGSIETKGRRWSFLCCV